MNILNTKHWVITLLLSLAGLAQANQTYWVNVNSLVQIPPYTNDWTEAAHTVQQVLPYVEDGDQIFVAEGTYTLTSSIVVTNDISIQGFWVDGPEDVVFDGQGLYTCFDLGDTDSDLYNFTIRNGKDPAVRCSGTQPLVNSCIIEKTDGTGMVKGRASKCTFQNNTGAYYGGGANSTIATDCSFLNNEATQGGGGYQITATGCTFQNNVSSREGGGLYNSTATNSLILANTASGSGGGMISGSAVGCAISGNHSSNYGGGLYQVTATHCTITENTANIGGGMTYGRAYNSILWNNTASDNSPNVYGTQIYSCCTPDSTTNGSITNNPQLVSLFHLAAASPCVGAGDAAYAALTDIEGAAWATPPSIGCDEVTSEGLIHAHNNLPQFITAGQEIFFDAYVEGPVTQTILDFGDGSALTNSTSLTQSHTWAYGNYHVVLTGKSGYSTSITNTIYVRKDETKTIYVSDADGDDSNDGLSWATARKTIQAGVDAQDYVGGLVLVSNGTYSVTEQINVNKNIRIESLNGAEQTIIQGDAYHRIFHLGNQHCRIKGFTIRNGGHYEPEGTSGGTIYSSSHDPVVEACLITGNTGNSGSIMWRGTATNCTFSFNAAGNGPGAMLSGIAVDCLFENNRGLGGGSGGGAMSGGVATRCVFKNNTNLKNGGAMYEGTAYDCQFIGNSTTSYGGGAYGTDAYNCVFNGNKANQYGGGLYGGSATHCTLTANRAVNGGGTYSSTLDHCIIWYNEALQSFDNIAYGTITTSCSPDLEHGVDGNITNNPQLVSASHIKLSSPCTGTGDILRDTLDIDGEHWRSAPAIGCDEPADPPTGAVTITLNGPTEIPAGFNAFYTVDFQGAFERDQIDFGDGFIATGSGVIPFGHSWSTPGTYDLIVTAWNNNHQDRYSITNTITVFDADFSTLYVRTDGDDNNNGRSWFNAKQTIQAAVDAQELHGGRVVVSNGTYTLTETISIDKDIQLLSANGAEHTIIDGGSTNDYTGVGCLDIADNHTTVRDITFRNGRDRNSTKYYSGGGIFCNYSLSPQISNCVFDGNSATKGGALAYGTATDCLFTNNWSWNGSGGGLYMGRANGCEFIGNYARDAGGGMYAGIATDCIFRENRCDSNYGGGMRYGTANRCVFENNTASYGGGLADGNAHDCRFNGNMALNGGGGMRYGTANRCYFYGNRTLRQGGGMLNGTANSCCFTGNKATDYGGAMAYTTANHCTITANHSGTKGGGMFSGKANSCIAWFNTADDEGNDLYSANPDYTCSPDATHGEDGCITNQPALVSASHLAVESPCRDLGDPATAVGTDIDGAVWLNAPPMGCDEPDMALSPDIEIGLIGPTHVLEDVAAPYIASFNGETKQTIIDFADGTRITNALGTIIHTWADPGTYDVVLTGYNLDNQQGTAFTQQVMVASAFTSSLHVDPVTGDDANHGLSWDAPKATIQAAVDAQNVYGGNVFVRGINHITATVNIDKSICVSGAFDSAATVDAGSSNRCFNLGYSECVLEYLTIRSGAASTLGYSNNEGGGIYCANSAPLITSSTIEGCVAYNGAGVYKGTLEHCTLSNNVASSSGGAAYESSLTQSTISSNSAQYGGGIYGGIANECMLSNNTATTVGGGAYYSTVSFSTLTDNTAPSGGGLASCTSDRCDIFFNYATSAHGGGTHKGTAHNCTIHNNAAIQYGGGTYSTTLYNCTVAENGAENGGGVYGSSVYNSIVWSNVAFNAENKADLASASARNSCSPDLTPSTYYGNITNAPLFVAMAPDILIRGGDYYLSNLSPCINAGENSYVSTDIDYNGLYRIRYGTVDMGACEMWLTGDSDGDEMDDAWELENFGGVTNAIASENADTDPHSNYEEYVAGTDPFDSDSYFRITQQELTNDITVLHWDSVYNRAYQVLWTDSLTNSFQPIYPAVHYPEESYTVENTNTAAFYKINVWID
ncbi:right-handed parallel beta-helix repeat-containing protein [Pontiella agarivorans]|uniref:PKD domain-containing protein n=1 Tax=Pontiella agarivorans TaxID=3038953 RepID=A0ABU5MXP0_9BACT|nr:right-handed parallel beta-helix repeat-containing protein [Pontiella agarivorans]MDZ8118942.1 PKD domain-containing protein [Pontiella agarivorans]